MSPSLGSVRRWYWAGLIGLPIGFVLGLPRRDLGEWLLAAPLVLAGWCAPVSRCFMLIGLYSVYPSALCGTPVLEFRDPTGSSVIPDGECGVMLL